MNSEFMPYYRARSVELAFDTAWILKSPHY